MAEIVMAESGEAGVGSVVEIAQADERGMTTAEYAMGIIAACTLMGVLIVVFNNPAFRELMYQLVTAMLGKFLKV